MSSKRLSAKSSFDSSTKSKKTPVYSKSSSAAIKSSSSSSLEPSATSSSHSPVINEATSDAVELKTNQQSSTYVASDTYNEGMCSPTTRRERMQLTQMPIVQNYLLIWLDSTIDESSADCLHSLTQLRRIINTINTFTDPDECVDFIKEIKNENVFIILSGALGSKIISCIHQLPQINSVYVFCGNKSKHEEWAGDWIKVKGVFTDINSICEVLQQHTQQCDRDSTPITITNARNPDELEPTFMYTTLFKEIILEIDYDETEITKLAETCRQLFLDNEVELKVIEEFKREYHKHTPIWWYTRECFLYHMLSRALRTFDTSTIVVMGLFIQGLYRRIKQLYSEQQHLFKETFTVYRGQGLSKTDFHTLQQSAGGLLSFNNFLSTSRDRTVSCKFASDASKREEHVGVLFRMTINPLVATSPFVLLLNEESYFEEQEQEILFSMNSIFRIGEIKKLQDEKELFEIQLSLTTNNDPLLHGLTERIREELSGSSGWHRLGRLLLQSGDYDNAENLYRTLLEGTPPEESMEVSFLNHQLGSVKYNQGDYAQAAHFYEKDLEISNKSLSPNHPDLATSYSGIGSVYSQMGEYSKALEYYEKAQKIRQLSLPPNHPDLATSYSKIGSVYSQMGEYSKALEYYDKAHKFYEKSLPPNHPNLATSYGMIGSVYSQMGEYSKALEYYEKDLEISNKSLPPNHPDLATSYSSIGSVYCDNGEYSKALEYYDKAQKIREKSLSSNHPDLAISYSMIGSVYSQMGEYSKALESYEKAHEIYEKSLPPNHPQLATSYSMIGSVYSQMGEYCKALDYYEKDLEISNKSLPPNHPDLATSYSKIGSVYCDIGEYSKALEYYAKAHKTCEKSLPPNHPNFASVYSWLGRIYRSMKDYSTALSYFEKNLDILKNILPEKHPSLAVTYRDIGDVKRLMGDYAGSHSYLQRALDIQSNVTCNRASLAWTYNYFGELHREMKDYSAALEFHEKARKIRAKLLSSTHPDMAVTEHNLAKVYKESKQFKLAYEHAQRAIEIAQQKLPEKHPDIVEYRNTMAEIRQKL